MGKKNEAVESIILRRLENERWSKRLLEQSKRKARRRSMSMSPALRETFAQKRRAIGARRADMHMISVPRILDLHSAHKELCDCVHQILEAVKLGRRVCLDFDGVQSMRTSALTYLLAQIYIVRELHGRDKVTGTYPSKAEIERQLGHSGFFQLLQVKQRAAGKMKGRATRYLRFKSHHELHTKVVNEVRDELLGTDLRMPPAIARTVFRALTEAMLNVGHHAYVTKQIRASSLKGRWWLLGTLHVKSNVFTLVFYDAGVGIPKTLPRTKTMEHIRGLLSMLPSIDPDDGSMIKAAMEIGRSRTALSHRGKGLMDVAKLIDKVGAGSLTIYSRHGAYRYNPGDESVKNHEGFLEGTLIEWTLPVDKALETLPEEIYAESQADCDD